MAAFEDGYNAYMGLPGDFVQATLLSAYHVFALIPISWEIVATRMPAPHWIWVTTFVVYVGMLIGIQATPSAFYWRHPLPYASFALTAFALSFAFTPIVVAMIALLVFGAVFAISLAWRVLRSRLYAALQVLLGRPPWLFREIVLVIYFGAYGWAFVRPDRKIVYNAIVTLVSIIAAIIVGSIEALDLFGNHLKLNGRFWSAIGTLNGNLGTLGCAIVGLFVVSWFVSVLMQRSQSSMHIYGADKSTSVE
ncbi:MAG: hypothetical protein WBD74_02810 [Candidatus Aquilonibacter sp.]